MPGLTDGVRPAYVDRPHAGMNFRIELKFSKIKLSAQTNHHVVSFHVVNWLKHKLGVIQKQVFL